MDHVSCCQATGMEGLVTTLRDPRYMEHDAYLMLDQIMRRLYHLCVERFPPSHCCSCGAGAAGGGRSEGGPLALSLLHVSVSSPAKSVKRAMAGTVCAGRG